MKPSLVLVLIAWFSVASIASFNNSSFESDAPFDNSSFESEASFDNSSIEIDEKIVGGNSVKEISQVPYQAALLRFGEFFCGGSIIGANRVLTAAHCTDGWPASSLTIRVGSIYHASGGKIVKVKQILQHPHYDSRTFDYDISILLLQSPLEFGPNVKPIKLPPQDKNLRPGTQTWVSGRGVLSEGGRVSPELQIARIEYVTDEFCKELYGPSLTSNMFCAGHYTKPIRDSCAGDSGGPLVTKSDLVGIVSWGVGCARPYLPGVYTAVSRFIPFINTERV